MRWILMAVLAWIVVILLGGCQDRYRYFCQNPDNFSHPDCQKPRCQFTQTCPEYLVAPILEKKIEQTQPTASEPGRN